MQKIQTRVKPPQIRAMPELKSFSGYDVVPKASDLPPPPLSRVIGFSIFFNANIIQSFYFFKKLFQKKVFVGKLL